MNSKKIKKRIILLVIFLPIILTVLPIKFVKNPKNIKKKKEFYIASCISEGTTDGGVWVVLGSNKGIFEDELSVYFKGKNPKNILSYDIIDSETEFIIYGKLTKEDDEEFYTLNSRKWEISNEVKRDDYSCRIPFRHFITVYDLNWFDFLLTDKGYD